MQDVWSQDTRSLCFNQSQDGETSIETWLRHILIDRKQLKVAPGLLFRLDRLKQTLEISNAETKVVTTLDYLNE